MLYCTTTNIIQRQRFEKAGTTRGYEAMAFRCQAVNVDDVRDCTLPKPGASIIIVGGVGSSSHPGTRRGSLGMSRKRKAIQIISQAWSRDGVHQQLACIFVLPIPANDAYFH